MIWNIAVCDSGFLRISPFKRLTVFFLCSWDSRYLFVFCKGKSAGWDHTMETKMIHESLVTGIKIKD